MAQGTRAREPPIQARRDLIALTTPALLLALLAQAPDVLRRSHSHSTWPTLVDHDALVSIIIPTYNRVGYLRDSVDSVLAQTFSRWELIVVDDGSTDGTASYLSSLTDERIKVVESAHCGMPSRLRNVGVARAKGRYIAFLDSDDMWAPTKLEAQVADLDRNPAARWSYTRVRWIDEKGEDRPLPDGSRWQRCEGWIFEQLVTRTAWVATPAVMVERSLFHEAGGFDETLRFSEDYELWLRLARLSPTSVVATPLVAVRQHPGNSWRTQGAQSLESWVGVYERLLADPALQSSRRVCLRMRARATAYLADRYRAERRYADGVRALIGVLPTGAALPSWWVALAKTSLRRFIPEPALRLYRRSRTPSAAVRDMPGRS